MAFVGNNNQDRRKVVLEVHLPHDDGSKDVFKYLIPRVKKYETLKAQKLRGKSVGIGVSDDEAIGMYMLADIIEKIEPLEEALSFQELVDERLSDESSNDLLKEVVRLATTSIVRLINEGVEVR